MNLNMGLMGFSPSMQVCVSAARSVRTRGLLLWFVLGKVTDLVKLGPPLLQDLWIPYFTITTDITASAMRVHTDGECVGGL